MGSILCRSVMKRIIGRSRMSEQKQAVCKSRSFVTTFFAVFASNVDRQAGCHTHLHFSYLGPLRRSMRSKTWVYAKLPRPQSLAREKDKRGRGDDSPSNTSRSRASHSPPVSTHSCSAQFSLALQESLWRFATS